jgi:hypothetical protein
VPPALSAAAPFAALTLAAVALLVAAEWRGWRAGVWAAKPLASTGFLARALAGGALDSRYGRLVFVARDFTNRAWGLPLYYAASLLLAMSVLS